MIAIFEARQIGIELRDSTELNVNTVFCQRLSALLSCIDVHPKVYDTVFRDVFLPADINRGVFGEFNFIFSDKLKIPQ